MISSIIFREAAELELQEGYEWYEAREKGLGIEFVEHVEACVQIIRRHPEIFPRVYKDVRQGVLRKFPYSVLYIALPDRIVVTAIFHASRNPMAWKRRV